MSRTFSYGKDSTQAAKYYTVQFSTDGERWRTAATRAEGNSFVITNLKGKTRCLVSVSATGDWNFTASASSDSVLVKTAFPTPTITSVRSTRSGQAVVSWRGESGAAQYELAWRENGSGEWKSVLVSSTDKNVSFTLSGLTSGTRCEFRVRVQPLDTSVQTSDWSSVWKLWRVK